jgi:hypothetical protein
MDFEEFEKKQEEKEQTSLVRYGSGAAGSSSGHSLAHGALSEEDFEEWENYMQFGFAPHPKNFHGF